LTSPDYLNGLFGLGGKRALVTGASRGLGLAFAATLSQAGAHVVLAGRNEANLARAAEALRQRGGDVSHVVFDVTDTASVDRGVAAAGAIDILVNNAGIQHRAPLEQFTDEDWRRIMSTNLDGVFRVSRAVARGMIERRGGSIVNISSVQSVLARPSIAPYAASKGALTMLTKSMAGEWGQYGIRVNALAPGYFKTDLNAALVSNSDFSAWLIGRTPMKRWGEVEELSGALLLLASPASSFMTGQTLLVDGGVTSVL
jgi:gluconate 5-dehydrogenase